MIKMYSNFKVIQSIILNTLIGVRNIAQFSTYLLENYSQDLEKGKRYIFSYFKHF